MERLSAVASHLTSTRPPPRVAGGLSFHHNSSAAADAKGALLRVGVIGAGLKGTQWARAFAIHPRCAVVAVADTDEDNRALFAERFGLGAESAHADYEEMLRTQRLDIVAPILPVEPNPAVVIRCASTPGLRAVVCEKPICCRLSEADEMVDACKRSDVHFAAGDAWRNLAAIWEAKRLIDDGAIGEVKSMNVYHPTDEIHGGGCQSLGLMRLFAGDCPVSHVTGWAGTDGRNAGELHSDGDQSLGGVVVFESGVRCTIHSEAVAKRGFEVLGTEGVFWSGNFETFEIKRMDDDDPTRTAWRPGLRSFWRGEDSLDFGHTRPDAPDGVEKDGWRTMATRQADSVAGVVDAVIGEAAEPRCTGDNLRQVLEVAIALRESARRGGVPQPLPLADRSSQIEPHPGRLFSKKGGALTLENYAQEIRGAGDTML